MQHVTVKLEMTNLLGVQETKHHIENEFSSIDHKVYALTSPIFFETQGGHHFIRFQVPTMSRSLLQPLVK